MNCSGASASIGSESQRTVTGGNFVRTSIVRTKQDDSSRDQIKELFEANAEWQKYNDGREAYVKQLQGEAAKKDAAIADLQNQVALTNIKYQTSEECRIKLEKENAELTCQLRNAAAKVQELSQRSNEAGTSSELLLVREEQVRAYKEDFESERRDRERTQSRLADVEMELEIVKRELRQYNLREMQDLNQRRQASMEYHRQEYQKKNPQSVYQMDHFDDRNPEDGEDEIDGC